MRRRFSVIAAVAGALLLPALPAQAAEAPIIVCSGVVTTTYDPPLGNTFRATNRTTTEELLCVPTSGMPFTGSRTSAVRGTFSCPIPADSPTPESYRYKWDNEHAPNSTVVKTVGYSGERMSSRTGSVIGGRYKGYSYIQVTDAVASSPCDGTTQTARRSTVTFTAP
ncbi:hypothetical protein Lesp02_67040 [Lentzea sp. NBRC 105346]|uniref:hypothetical protein n=1 Tax=Lentzea sp. NBRC 105346 TaxID=3032205 RepID=UPI0024A520CC|nr:hypothetical protein [Lentzea sp. NBRC 105346]GLZ34517.1 hypothetical protein Lesp02_67040 [Lentzea sp. NBRC 105346]